MYPINQQPALTTKIKFFDIMVREETRVDCKYE